MNASHPPSRCAVGPNDLWVIGQEVTGLDFPPTSATPPFVPRLPRAKVRAFSADKVLTQEQRNRAVVTHEPGSDLRLSLERGQDLNLRPLDATRAIATATDKTRKLPNTSV